MARSGPCALGMGEPLSRIIISVGSGVDSVCSIPADRNITVESLTGRMNL